MVDCKSCLLCISKYAYNSVMNDKEIITKLGGTSATARLCKITPQAVSQWKSNGIPRSVRPLLVAYLENKPGKRLRKDHG